MRKFRFYRGKIDDTECVLLRDYHVSLIDARQEQQGSLDFETPRRH